MVEGVTPMQELRVDGVSASYRGVRVLWEVSLEVRARELVALVGANAAGKSTLLKVISGLKLPDEGSVLWDGEDLVGASPARVARAGVIQIPQGRQLFPRMTVRENLEAGASYLRRARNHAEETLAQVVDLFPALRSRMQQMAGTLSGGEQQMVAVGRALMSRPSLLLVDEPSLGLAPKLVDDLFDAIVAINKEGVGVLLVEQNVRLSLDVAERAYVMEQGRIVTDGPSHRLLQDGEVRRAYFGM